MSNAITIEHVTKTFGPKVAVRDLNLVVPQGALYGLIGPNGAGKTTTIRILMSILFPDQGSVSVLGHGSALEAKDRIGYLPEERGVYKKMKVGTFLSYMARLKGLEGPEVKGRVRQWLERVGLPEVENKRCEELSKGMQQKIQFISTVLHEPDLLILDEPFSGLDPVNMRLLRDLFLAEHKRGATIIFSTHVMVQAEQLCEHLVMIHDGEKVLDDSLEGIRAKYDPREIQFEPLNTGADLSALHRARGVAAVESANGVARITLDDGADPATTMQEIVAAVPPARVELHRPTLEDVFVQIVTDANAKTADSQQLRAALRADPTAATEETG